MPIILIIIAWFSQETEQWAVWVLGAAGTVITNLLLQTNKLESDRRLQVYFVKSWNSSLNLDRLTVY